jgi:hypothetical protein
MGNKWKPSLVDRLYYQDRTTPKGGDMAGGQLHGVIGQLRRLIGDRNGGVSDAELLADFVTRRDERAFEVLVWRHGTMVLSLCQRVLHDCHVVKRCQERILPI